MAPQTIDLLVQVAASLIFLCSHTRCCEVDSNFPGDNNDYQYLANTREFLLDLNCFNCNGSGEVYWIEYTVDHNGVRSETHKSSSVQTTVNTTTVFQCINTNTKNGEDPWRSKPFIIYFELNSTECSLLPSSSIMPSSCASCSTASDCTSFPTPSSSMVSPSPVYHNTTVTHSFITTISTTVCPLLTDAVSVMAPSQECSSTTVTLPVTTTTSTTVPDRSSSSTINNSSLTSEESTLVPTSSTAPADSCPNTLEEVIGISSSLSIVITVESLVIAILILIIVKIRCYQTPNTEQVREIAISNGAVLEMNQAADDQHSTQSEPENEAM